MKQTKGFSLIELLVAVAITVLVMGVSLSMLTQAEHATEGVALQANVQENLRAGMHFIVRDLMQAGEGIPPGGVLFPGASNINRPGTTPAITFPVAYTYLPAINPGWQLGQPMTGVSATTGQVINTGAANSDILNVLYADNSLADSSGGASPPFLNSFPIIQGPVPGPACAGVLPAAGTSVTLDPACFKMPGQQPTPIAVGNLMMFSNNNGTALAYVTGVAGQVINFAGGDPAGLNGLGVAVPGSLANLLSKGAAPTTITRVWMVTYYLDTTTNPTRPQLMRQVNYPNYPAGAAVDPPQALADGIEALQFTYDIINSSAPAGTYPNGPGDAPAPNPLFDNPSQIRAANVLLAGRSEYAYTGAGVPRFFRNNLSTQVSIRSLSFSNQFNTSATAPSSAP
jgi:prepilin-type N-terminal cleavage/methylation domain-containing protein